MPKIIEIKKMPGCALLRLESGERLRVPLSLLRERPARVGQEIAADTYQQLMETRGYAHAMDGAVKMLSLCDRSEGEIRERLAKNGYPDAVIARVIGKLYEADLLNDEAFAQRWTQSRGHKLGRNRLSRELARRGIDRETAEQALSKLSDEDQLDDAVRLTGKFLGRTRGDFDRKLYQRTLAMLARHGYDADIARRAIEIIAKGEDAALTGDFGEPERWMPKR